MNNNTETRKNKHLNERERYAIELYLKEKYTVTERVVKNFVSD
jgi:IS30 family transposase